MVVFCEHDHRGVRLSQKFPLTLWLSSLFISLKCTFGCSRIENTCTVHYCFSSPSTFNKGSSMLTAGIENWLFGIVQLYSLNLPEANSFFLLGNGSYII